MSAITPIRGAAANSQESFVELESRAGRGGPAQATAPRGAAGRPPEAAEAVVAFWRDAGPARWFAKDPDFDHLFRDRFLALYETAARGALGAWLETPLGALALVILLDQYPRNAFRGTPRMYAADALAREMASLALRAGHDQAIEPELRFFLYMPFAHSENLADQELSVALNRRLGEFNAMRAEHHRDIVRRFGRFPHRNPILGRAMTAEEQRFLDEGGYAG